MVVQRLLRFSSILLKKDTKFRAVLHRTLDLLVYKFFLVIIKHGFYHGDPHAGNIFFSFKKKQAILIDLGAVGELNVYEENVDGDMLESPSAYF